MRLPLGSVLLGLLPFAGLVAAAEPAQTAASATAGQGASEAGPAVAGFVGVAGAVRLMQAGAVVLDARGSGYLLAHLPAAQAVDWRDYRDGWGRTGRLHPDAGAMAGRLARLGVDAGRPVLVYGEGAQGFGEEGRIAWLLLYLGHQQVYLLDGGLAAWRGEGRPIERGPTLRSPRPGTFPPQVQAALRADRAAVQRTLGTAPERPILVDVRSEAEWHGATPYFEARGGRIPGARWLEWVRLLDPSGKLKSDEVLGRELSQLGLQDRGHEIIVYCTGGVRSAFVVMVLKKLGYTRVRNYDGSFWEWAADRSLPVETSPRP